MDLLSTPTGAPIIILVAGTATFLAAYVIAQIAIRAGVLLDRPNARSSHNVVTPRSGGVAIFAAWAVGMAIVAALTHDPDVVRLTIRLTLIAGLVVLVGLADDVLAPRALFKLVGQVVAAALYVAAFGALSEAPIPFIGEISLGAYGAPLTIFWIVALMNAFNFMDGVNGIAATCGAFALGGLAVASAYAGAGFWAIAAMMCAIALFGFLPLNFPKGRIFMGDNGSQTIGFLVAAIAVAATKETDGAVSALFMPVAVFPFLFDVAFTLAHRIIRRKSIISAHREHLYQLLLRLGYSHIRVTAVYLSLTALSTAGAVLMLRLAPREHWFAPLALALLMATPAALLFARARRFGLLALSSADVAIDRQGERDAVVDEASAHAAE